MNDEDDHFDPSRPFESKSNKTWKQLYYAILGKSQPIPVVKMCLKAKQLAVNYRQLEENFMRGRPVGEVRKNIAQNDESQFFKGCP